MRGRLIKFDVDALNTFLKTPGVIEEGESLPAYSKRAASEDLEEEPDYSGLELKSPTSHTSDITLDRAKLIYGLVMQMDTNLGSLISGQISLIVQNYSSRLGFPALITALCKARGVTSDSLTFESLSPAINLAYIKKNCWNLDDPSATQKSRARRSEGPLSSAPAPAHVSTSAPFASSPSTSTTLVPPVLTGFPAQSSEHSLSMLQSLHQGQLLIMQSLQDVVHQRPVMSVEQFLQKEPQPAKKDASADISEPSPSEPFSFETDPVIVQDDVVVPEPSSQPEPEPSAPVLDLPISYDPPSAPTLDLNDATQDN
ncbi:hypothetical protein GmHk_06G016954 [Glycine max]|nr:hypothetical protein GmHk_06G016954 [Glycine max]